MVHYNIMFKNIFISSFICTVYVFLSLLVCYKMSCNFCLQVTIVDLTVYFLKVSICCCVFFADYCEFVCEEWH